MHSQLNREKLRSAILRIISRCPPQELGAVKLHKALYYADMIEFAACGRSLTGAEYRKRPFGPTCDEALPIIRELQSDGALDVVDVPYYGYAKREFRLRAEPRFDQLSKSELALLDDMADFVCREHTARAISEISHDVSWQMVE
ncbi:MAG TPA: Panacea domain-containing protein, partial [Alphaproteobacteria bacterium]|nr:Panacea domain-containing protein [Alphaproteobacteria bacterium]